MLNYQKLQRFTWDAFLLQNLFSITSVQMYVENIAGNHSEIIYSYHKDFDYDNSGENNHWILHNKRNGKKVCSIETGVQNIKDDINDNLCQLYSVIACMNIRLPSKLGKNNKKNKIRKHKLIVATIRKLVNRSDFITMLQCKMNNIQKDFKEMDFLENEHYLFYEINTRNCNIRKAQYLLNDLNITLDDWENFGYRHFINNGK